MEQGAGVRSRRPVAFVGGVDGDAPPLSGGIAAPTEDLAAYVDQIVPDALPFEHAGDLVHGVSFGDGVESDLYLGVLLYEPSVADGYLVVTDVSQKRIDVGRGLLPPADEAVGVHERLYGDVVFAAGEFADAAGERDVAGDVFGERVGFVAVDAAQQRTGVEYRHGAVGLGADRFHLGPQVGRCRPRHGHLVEGAQGESLDRFRTAGGVCAGGEQRGCAKGCGAGESFGRASQAAVGEEAVLHGVRFLIGRSGHSVCSRQ